MTGDEIVRLRKKMGLTQRNLAEKLHLSAQEISHFENNRRKVGEEHRMKMEEVFMEEYGVKRLDEIKDVAGLESAVGQIAKKVPEGYAPVYTAVFVRLLYVVCAYELSLSREEGEMPSWSDVEADLYLLLEDHLLGEEIIREKIFEMIKTIEESQREGKLFDLGIQRGREFLMIFPYTESDFCVSFRVFLLEIIRKGMEP